MAKTVTVNFRMDARLKKELDALASRLHMNFSALMNLCAEQLVQEQSLSLDKDDFLREDSEFGDGDTIIADGVSEEQLRRWMK